jgi:hypothetical protein
MTCQQTLQLSYLTSLHALTQYTKLISKSVHEHVYFMDQTSHELIQMICEAEEMWDICEAVIMTFLRQTHPIGPLAKTESGQNLITKLNQLCGFQLSWIKESHAKSALLQTVL